ncbi:uncharacterized protein [Excalfactoria chinensis]|uniref:uncharacterized protein n=1 Tax=Excalfactoria chinensis TaxID=46218 RepID=UPI003B3BDE58
MALRAAAQPAAGRRGAGGRDVPLSRVGLYELRGSSVALGSAPAALRAARTRVGAGIGVRVSSGRMLSAAPRTSLTEHSKLSLTCRRNTAQRCGQGGSRGLETSSTRRYRQPWCCEQLPVEHDDLGGRERSGHSKEQAWEVYTALLGQVGWMCLAPGAQPKESLGIRREHSPSTGEQEPKHRHTCKEDRGSPLSAWAALRRVLDRMAELANWVIQWGPNPWGPNSCRSIQQADLEFGRLKEMAKSKLFSRKSLKCAGAWAVWLAAKSQAEEKEAAQAEIQRLKEENGKLKAEIKAQRLKLEEGKTRESIAAVEQVRSILQYQEVCEQKKAVVSENVALKDKLAVSTRTVEEFQGAIRALVQKIQALKEKGTDHRACEAKVEKLKAALGAKHSMANLAKTTCQEGGEPWDGAAWLDPEGSPCEEKCGAASPCLPGCEGGERGQPNPAGAQAAVKKESGGMEEGESRGEGQLQADGGTGGEPTGAPTLRQHKAASSQAAGPAWAREDGGGSGRGRGGKGWRKPENKKDWGATHSPGLAAAPALLPSGGRWPGRRPWQSGTGPRLGARSNVARRELGTMRVNIWRQLRQHGEDMARWDNAPTRALLERLLEISGSREGGRAAAPALPVVV